MCMRAHINKQSSRVHTHTHALTPHTCKACTKRRTHTLYRPPWLPCSELHCVCQDIVHSPSVYLDTSWPSHRLLTLLLFMQLAFVRHQQKVTKVYGGMWRGCWDIVFDFSSPSPYIITLNDFRCTMLHSVVGWEICLCRGKKHANKIDVEHWK